MAVFLSTYVNKIDSKGRVSVPVQFRNALIGQSFNGIVAFRSYTSNAIEAFGIDRMEKLSSEVDTMDMFSQKQSDMTASIFADSQMLAFDKDGRISLPEILRSHATLIDEIAFVGRGPTFQLWNPKEFSIYQEKARDNMKNGFVNLNSNCK